MASEPPIHLTFTDLDQQTKVPAPKPPHQATVFVADEKPAYIPPITPQMEADTVQTAETIATLRKENPPSAPHTAPKESVPAAEGAATKPVTDKVDWQTAGDPTDRPFTNRAVPLPDADKLWAAAQKAAGTIPQAPASPFRGEPKTDGELLAAAQKEARATDAIAAANRQQAAEGSPFIDPERPAKLWAQAQATGANTNISQASSNEPVTPWAEIRERKPQSTANAVPPDALSSLQESIAAQIAQGQLASVNKGSDEPALQATPGATDKTSPKWTDRSTKGKGAVR